METVVHVEISFFILKVGFLTIRVEANFYALKHYQI
jgi:hypothetical protein